MNGVAQTAAAGPALRVFCENTETGEFSDHLFQAAPDTGTGLIRLGRVEFNELRLEDARISRWHAEIHFGPDGVFFTDNRSANGSMLDGALVEPETLHPLAGRSEIVVTPFRLTWAALTMQAEPEPRVAEGAAPSVGMPQRPAAAQPPPPASAEIEATVTAAEEELGLKMAEYLGARDLLVSELDRMLGGLDQTARAQVLAGLRQRHPALGAPSPLEPPRAEEPPREVSDVPTGGVPQPPAQPMADAPVAAAAAALWRRFLGPDVPSSPEALARTVTVAGEAVGAFAEVLFSWYLHVQKLGEEYGLATGARDGLLRRVSMRGGDRRGPAGGASPAEVSVRGTRELLAFLFEEGPDRVGELRRAFAELVAHDAALSTAAVASATKLIEGLSPDRLGGESKDAWFGGSDAARWKAFVKAYERLAPGSAGFDRRFFAAGFEQAYLAHVPWGAARSLDSPSIVWPPPVPVGKKDRKGK